MPTESEEEATGSSSMWTLGKRKMENALNVTVKEYDGKILIHFRHYFKLWGKIAGIRQKRGWH